MPIEPANPFSAPSANLENPVAASAPSDALAAPTTRLAAVLLDGLLFVPAVILFAIGGTFGRAASGSEPNLIPIIAGGLYVLALAAYQIYLLSTQGQTLGKRWMKIRIVRLDGSPPGFVHAFLLRSVVSALPRLIPVAGNAFSLIDALFIFRQDRRCIHDLIASTRVVPAPER
ncbi:MAG TPA: RDD family protein [Polyangia bacterium]|nr:RDD family protein [Polyangia bacterium]